MQHSTEKKQPRTINASNSETILWMCVGMGKFNY